MILLPLGIGLFGCLVLGLGLFCFLRDRRRLPHSSEFGEGVVSGFTEPDDEGFVRVRVMFVSGGKTFNITGSVGSNPPGYRVGQRIAVRYPPGKPRLALIADFRHLYLFSVSAIAFGTVSVGVAVLLLVLQWLY